MTASPSEASRGAGGRAGGPDARVLLLVAMAVLAAWLGYRLALTTERFLDADELVHLNAAWFVSQGEPIYARFFENHPPGMALLLQPVVRSAATPEPMIERGRALMFALTLGVLLAVADLARRSGGALAAWLAPGLLVGHTYFFQKTLEIRPDVPALLLFALALCALARALATGRRRWPLLAGALLCAAGLFTPKVIYAAAGACAGAALTAGAASPRGPRAGARLLGWIAPGGLAVAALACAEMAREGILEGFVNDAVLQSLRITIDDPGRLRSLYLTATARIDGVLWAVAALGAWSVRRRLFAGDLAILAGSFAAGLAGTFHIDAPMRQVFLPLLPATAVVGALGLAAGARALHARHGSTAAAGALLAASLALAAGPLVHLAGTTAPMQTQLRILRQVLAASAPRERVFDCFSGLYLTRLPAYRYFYLNSDLQRLFTPEALTSELVRALAAPDVKIVLFDGNCRKLPAPVQEFVRSAFAPLARGGGLVWVRNR